MPAHEESCICRHGKLKDPEFSESHTPNNLGFREIFQYLPSKKERKGSFFFLIQVDFQNETVDESHAYQSPNHETDLHLKHPCFWHK